MNLYSKKVGFILLLVIFGIFGCLASAKALTIAPPLMDIEANPGSIIQGTIKLTNDTPEKAQFFSSINRFEAKGEKGEPQFITEEAERIGLINWIDITPLVLLNYLLEKAVKFLLLLMFLKMRNQGVITQLFFGAQVLLK